MKVNTSLYRVIVPIIKVLFKFLYWPKIIGKENIPKKGGFILAANHKHLVDCVSVVSTNRRINHYMAKIELKKGLLGYFITRLGVMYVDRSKSNEEARNKAVELLKEGRIVAIHPEGTFNRTDEPLAPFKYGAVTMAKKAGVKIIPMAIIGKYKMFKKGLIIKVGKPLDIAEMDIEEANKFLRESMLKLLLGEEVVRNG